MDGKEGGQEERAARVESTTSRRKCSSGRLVASSGSSSHAAQRGPLRVAPHSTTSTKSEAEARSKAHTFTFSLFFSILVIITARLSAHTAHTRQGGGRARLARLLEKLRPERASGPRRVVH